VIQPQLQRPATGDALTRAVGWLLLLPAVVLTVLTLVLPTVRMIDTSMRGGRLTSDAEPDHVGFDNYDHVFGDARLWPSLWFALSLVVVPVVVTVVVAPLLSAAFSWAGGWARWTARIVLSATLVVFSPVALSIVWQRRYRETDPTLLADPDLVGGALRLTVAGTTFGVACAVGVMVFLPVFRAREQRRPMWPALFTTAGVVALGLLAVGLQQFTVPFVMTGFGPVNETMTPVGLEFTTAFRDTRVGVGAAVGVVLLALLAVLGVAAVLLVVLTRLRVSLLPRRSPAGAPRLNPLAIVVAVLVLVAVVTAIVLNALPWFDALSGPDLDSPPDVTSRTWWPALLWALVSVGVAYLAALGISGLRPLGRHSEWLLLPFAPWLFVGTAPLSVQFFLSLREQGELDTGTALRPQILVSILSMVVLAVLCRGQSAHWRHQVAAGAPAGPAFLRAVVLPTLPLAGLLAVVTTLLTAQDAYWPLLVSLMPENDTVPLAMLRAQGNIAGADFSVASATPLAVVVLAFAALVAVQVLHLDRMVATTGGQDEPLADGERPPTP
jgi:ABC-type sugar transport system permease subunit